MRLIGSPIAVTAVSLCCLLSACSSSTGPDPEPFTPGIVLPAQGTSVYPGDSLTVAWKSRDLKAGDMVTVTLFNAETSIVVGDNVPALLAADSGAYTFFVFDSLIWDYDRYEFTYTVLVKKSGAEHPSYTSPAPVTLRYGILQPVPGSIYNVGDTLRVSWVWNYFLCYDWQAVLKFSSDNGKTLIPFIDAGVAINRDTYRGEFSWVIPDELEGLPTRSMQCVIEASPYSGGGEYFRVRSGLFTIQ
jgi:hypothetical protein